MKNFKQLTIFMVLFVLGTKTVFAQSITCGDFMLQVLNNNPAVPLEANCDYDPNLANEDCFLLSFPVFFTYTGSSTNPPSNFTINGLTITGSVTGSTNIFIDEDNTERCESQNLTMDFDPSDNTFAVTAGSASLAFSPPLGGQVAFWIFVEARPFDFVDIDFSEITVELPNGGGTCNLDTPTVGTTTQGVAGDCQLTDMSLDWNISTSGNEEKTIQLIFNHGHSDDLQVGRLDGQIKITDTYNNLEEKDFTDLNSDFPGLMISQPEIINGNEYIYYFTLLPDFAIPSGNNIVGTAIIKSPEVLSEAGEATIDIEWARWKMEGSGVDECCQPSLGAETMVDFTGQFPCAPAGPEVTFSVQPAANSPLNAGCLGDIHYDVTIDKTNGLDFQLIDLQIEFETMGDVVLNEATTLDIFDSGYFCPDPAISSNPCAINGNCLSTGSTNQSIRYRFCTGATGSGVHTFPTGENSFRVVFSGTLGCVKSAKFRRALIRGIDSEGNSFNCVPDWENNSEETCIDVSNNTAGDYPITGTILTAPPFNVAVNNVDVEIISDNCDELAFTSDVACDGVFINSTCDDAEATIAPSKNTDYLCGISTFDLVLISKHILAIEVLDSPYKIIAADANSSGTVSTLDLVQIRKLILHIDDAFSNSPSWRFVDASYEFPNATNPFVPPYPQSIDDFDLECSPNATADFIGIKIGDINGSCNDCTTNNPNNQGEFGDPIVLTIEKEVQGNEAIFKFKTEGFTDIVGYQMDLQYDKNVLSFDRSMAQDLAGVYEDYFGINTIGEGKIRTLWYDENGSSQSLSNFEKIFNIVFNGEGDLSSATVNLFTNEGSRLRRPVYNNVAYDSEGRMHPIIQKFGTVKQNVLDLQAFPNPFTNIFQLDITTDAGEFAQIKVFDTVGKLMFTQKKYLYEGQNIFDIQASTDWSKGLYFYEVETNQGKYTGKITKQ